MKVRASQRKRARETECVCVYKEGKKSPIYYHQRKPHQYFGIFFPSFLSRQHCMNVHICYTVVIILNCNCNSDDKCYLRERLFWNIFYVKLQDYCLN